MFDDLLQTIEKLKARIREHGAYIAPYESRTRVALIDPLLTALGWDVSDPSFVQIEPRTVNGWADYALLGSNSKPVAYVEAKKLRSAEDATGQTVSYAVQENIQSNASVGYCASTDGDYWVLYNVFTQREVMRAAISNPDSAKTALQLIAIWRRSMADGSVEQAAETVLADAVEATAGPDPESIEIPPPPPPPPPPEVWTPLTEVGAPKGATAPQEMKLPDGTIKPLRNWRSVLLETALYLHGLGTLTRSNCTYRIGRIRYLFSTEGVHPTGVGFKSQVPLGKTGIIMEGNFSAADLVRHTAKLMERFGHDPEGVLLKF